VGFSPVLCRSATSANAFDTLAPFMRFGSSKFFIGSSPANFIFTLCIKSEMSSGIPLLSRKFGRHCSSEINLHISLGLIVDKSFLFQVRQSIFELPKTVPEEIPLLSVSLCVL